MTASTDMSQDRSASPFLIRCSTCGAPADFDIREHVYKCAHCGASTDAKAPLDDLARWRRAAKDSRDASLRKHPAAICTCPSCGASMAVNEGEMSGTCPFCGSTMARRPAGEDERIPEVVIPFVLTPEEAQKRLDRWLELNPKDRCAARVRQHRGSLEAVFLPYRLVKGPVTCQVERKGASRTYKCGAFVNGSAVNASKDMPNLVLDAMEPFDWSEARAFDWGYLSGGQKARFPDLTQEQLDKRTLDELSEACRPMVEKALMTVGVQVEARMDEALDMPALLPVYVLRTQGLRCFVNGQTGRVSVSDGSTDTRTNRWWLPPLILSLLSFWLILSFNAAAHTFALKGGSFGLTMLRAMTAGFFSGESLSIVFRQTLNWMPPFLVPPVLFFIFRRNRAQATSLHITATPRCRAVQTGDAGNRLNFIESKDAIEDAAEVRPIFFEKEPKTAGKLGSGVQGASNDFWTAQGLFPARIRFFPPRRIARWTLQTILTAFFPAIVNGIGALCGAEVFVPALTAMSGFWLLVVAPWPLISAAKRIGIHVFNKPAIQRICPDGSFVWVERGEDESIFLGLKQIFAPFFSLLSKSLNWAMGTSLGTTLGIGVFGFCLLPLILSLALLPAIFCLGPMLDSTGSGLEQASSKGSSMRLLEAMFAMSSNLTQEEWDALPQIDLQEMMFAAAGPLRRLSDQSIPKNRREQIKIRLKRTLGEGEHLRLTESAEASQDSMDVKIPRSGGHSAKLLMAKPNQSSNKLTITIIDLETKIPEDKLPLVTEFLDNFQRALPLGGFSATGSEKDRFAFSLGLSVRGMKRIPKSWDELMTFWPLDVIETAEGRIRELIDGKTTNVTPDEKDLKELSDDFWLLALWDGDEAKMRLGTDPGKFDRVQDLTPDQVIARFDEYLAQMKFTAERPTELSRTFVFQLQTNRGTAFPTVTIDASRPKTVLIRAAVKLKTNEAGEQGIRRRLFKAYLNTGGFYRTYFDPEEKVLVAEQRLFLRLLKNPPDDLAKSAIISALANAKSSVEKGLKNENAPKAPADSPEMSDQ